LVLAIIGKKGSISIEFILLVTIGLVYIYTTVWPSVDISTNAALDVKGVADTKISAIKLADAINEAGLASGDMKKTITIFLPSSSEEGIEGEIFCEPGDDRIKYEVLVSPVGFNPKEMDVVTGIGCDAVEDAGTIVRYKCTSYVSLLSSAAAILPRCPDIDRRYGKLVIERKTEPSDEISVDWKS